MEDFIKQLKETDKIDTDLAGMKLYDFVYDLILKNDIESIIYLINELSINKYSIFVKISLLRITKPYKSNLSKYRQILFDSLRDELNEYEINHFSDTFL